MSPVCDCKINLIVNRYEYTTQYLNPRVRELRIRTSRTSLRDPEDGGPSDDYETENRIWTSTTDPDGYDIYNKRSELGSPYRHHHPVKERQPTGLRDV